MLDWLTGQELLQKIDSLGVLKFLSERGSVDGVTRENTLTEDGLPAQDGIDLIDRLQELVAATKLKSSQNG